MEIGCEVADDSEVRVCGTICVMTTLEFLQHFLAKLGHGDLLFSVTQLISTVSLSPSAEVQTRGSVRRERLRPNRHFTHHSNETLVNRIETNRNLSVRAVDT